MATATFAHVLQEPSLRDGDAVTAVCVAFALVVESLHYPNMPAGVSDAH